MTSEIQIQVEKKKSQKKYQKTELGNAKSWDEKYISITAKFLKIEDALAANYDDNKNKDNSNKNRWNQTFFALNQLEGENVKTTRRYQPIHEQKGRDDENQNFFLLAA